MAQCSQTTKDRAPKIIGISAKKQGGKTTAARFLATRHPGRVRQVAFADALKHLVIQSLLFVDPQVCWPEDLDEEEVKGRRHPCGKTYRELLQIVGTDWFRSLWPDVWVERYRATVRDFAPHLIVVTPDVRFPNEVEAIHALGGHVLRLTLAPLADDPHISERALDGYDKFDAVIDNRHMTIPEQNAATWAVVEPWLGERT